MGEGRIRHLREHLIDHVIMRMEKDRHLSMRDIEREYRMKHGQLYMLLKKEGLDAEFFEESRDYIDTGE